MKILPTSGSLNKCVGQCINAAPKKKKRERAESQRKLGLGGTVAGGEGGWGGYCVLDKGESECVQDQKFNYNCALAVILLV